MEQLRLWKAMGCRLDAENEHYREFRAFQSALAYEMNGYVDGAALAALPEAAGGAAVYRCRKCRVLLASGRNAIAVAPGPGPAAFAWRKRDKQPAAAAEGAEPAVFVEPLAWMAETLAQGQTQGKLYCPECHARVGSYNWAGTQNASGRWVVPAFQLHSSKLDVEGGGGGLAPVSRAAVPRLLPSRGPAGPAGAAPAPAGPAPARRFTHLIFDCDGVMVDTEPASCEALRQALVGVGWVKGLGFGGECGVGGWGSKFVVSKDL